MATLKEVTDFYLYYKDEIDLEMEDGWEIDVLTNNIYYDCSNWNNGDIGTGMYVHSKGEIQDLLEGVEYIINK